jgi:hypothetical protein
MGYSQKLDTDDPYQDRRADRDQIESARLFRPPERSTKKRPMLAECSADRTDKRVITKKVLYVLSAVRALPKEWLAQRSARTSLERR